MTPAIAEKQSRAGQEVATIGADQDLASDTQYAST